jgi:NADH-quinone oxidoreductase subunit G
MCTRCVRFTKEVSGTSELMVAGRGNKEEIDVFPGIPLDNELSANVVDLCPVGALLDKDFLFTQRVWFLKSTPSIDGITASGDNIFVEHNQGKVYRIKPRANPAVNKWWITDEVRYGWKHIHADHRLRTPYVRQYGSLAEADFARAYEALAQGVRKAAAAGQRTALMVSPMLPCEEAFLLAKAARELDPNAILAVGPVPVKGQDKVFPAGAAETDKKAFKMYAEKAPNARGVRRVLSAFGPVLEYADFVKALPSFGAVILTGNYPSPWATPELEKALDGRFVALIDTHEGSLLGKAAVVLPGATWVEKAGTFENARGMLQAFEQAIPVTELAKTEGQIALDLLAELAKAPVRAGNATWQVVETTRGQVAAAVEVAPPRAKAYNAANTRIEMAKGHEALAVFATGVSLPIAPAATRGDMPLVEL